MSEEDACSVVDSVKEHHTCENCPIRYHAWNHKELEELYYMSFHNHTIPEMCREFQRPKKQIIKALRRMQAQQCLFHSIEDVALAHNMPTEKLIKRLKDTLYYVPVQSNSIHPILIITSVMFGLVSMYGYMCYIP